LTRSYIQRDLSEPKEKPLVFKVVSRRSSGRNGEGRGVGDRCSVPFLNGPAAKRRTVARIKVPSVAEGTGPRKQEKRKGAISQRALRLKDLYARSSEVLSKGGLQKMEMGNAEKETATDIGYGLQRTSNLIKGFLRGSARKERDFASMTGARNLRGSGRVLTVVKRLFSSETDGPNPCDVKTSQPSRRSYGH